METKTELKGGLNIRLVFARWPETQLQMMLKLLCVAI